MTTRRPSSGRERPPPPVEETTFEEVPEEDTPPPKAPARRPRAPPDQPVHGPKASRKHFGIRIATPSESGMGEVWSRPFPTRPDRPANGPRTHGRAPSVLEGEGRRPPRVNDRPASGPPPARTRAPPRGGPQRRGPPLPPKDPFNNGTYVGLLGKLVYLIALFLPWYSLTASVKSGDFATNGWVELVHVDGIKGIQINELLTGGALPKGLSYIPVPISWVLIFFFIWSVVSIVFARTARERGWKMLRGGIVILIVFAIIYVLVSKLTTFIPEDSPTALRSILDYIAAYPYGGRTSQTFGDYGTVSLQWGLQVGGYLLLVSGIVQVIGGVAELRWRRTALRSAAPGNQRI